MVDGHDSDREVLTSLPRSRPTRRSSKRGDSPATPSNGALAANGAGAAQPPADGAKAAAGSATKQSAARGRAGAKAAAGGATKQSATRGRAGAKAAAGSAPTTGAGARRAAATATADDERTTSRPRARATRARERTVPPAGYAAPKRSADEPPGTGAADVISTTIQATAELAQIGVAVGRQLLHSMFERLPKP